MSVRSSGSAQPPRERSFLKFVFVTLFFQSHLVAPQPTIPNLEWLIYSLLTTSDLENAKCQPASYSDGFIDPRLFRNERCDRLLTKLETLRALEDFVHKVINRIGDEEVLVESRARRKRI